MQLHQLISILRRLFGRKRALARCPVRSRRQTKVILLFAVAMSASPAVASVLVSGNVLPSDNPFTLLQANGLWGNEGLPGDGNFINPFEGPTAAAQSQFEFIGGYTTAGALIPLPNGEIIVGDTSFGVVLISGESAIRSETLVIGDSGSVNGVTKFGTGVVRITGFGSLYNNDPLILPFSNPSYQSFGTKRDPDGGYDLYVGRDGTGTFEVSAGARAEIQDAVIVGDATSATGSIIVDGFDSFFGSGGFEGGNVLGEQNGMIIGNQGVGYMTIRNGATVQTDIQAQVAGNDVSVAASIGGEAFGQTGDTVPGGVGNVTVTGVASKWILHGTLQVGGFNLGTDATFAFDLEGDDTVYNSEAGRGTLYVQDGAFVNVLSPLGTTDPTQDSLFLAVGRFGRVILSGNSLINVGEGTDDESRGDNNVVINDGVIQGNGRINTGVFRNRYLGEVRVGPNEHLIIDSSSDFRDPGTDAAPLVNWGVMQAFGTQDAKADLEFERALDDPTFPVQPFLNLRIDRPAGAPLADFYGGLISAQHSILRFRSGILNGGMMAFTAGNNYVTGNVINLPGPIPMPADTGIIIVSGPGTKVTFENDLINAGVLSISGGATVEILARHSFVTAGNLKMTLTPTSSNKIVSAGDAGIDGKLTLSLSGFSPGSLHIGDSFEIINVTGSLGGVNLSNPNYPTVDLMTAPAFDFVQFPSLISLGLPGTAALVPIYTSSSVLVTVSNFASAIGPDFNGDGVINNLDLNIWLANVGTTSGASVTQGDADGDGDVDGDDYLFWQRNYGKPMPWTGAGSGSGSGAAVPEPTGLALLLLGSAFTFATRHRRRSR